MPGDFDSAHPGVWHRPSDRRGPDGACWRRRSGGGALAAAVSRAGALGLIGGGYGDAAWLAEQFAQAERRPDRVRQELLARCRTERIEPPAAQRIDRIVRSALHQAEQMLSLRIASRLAAQVARRLEALVVVGDDEDGDGRGVLALVKSVPGNVSLETMLTEIGKLEAGHDGGQPGWRGRCCCWSSWAWPRPPGSIGCCARPACPS